MDFGSLRRLAAGAFCALAALGYVWASNAEAGTITPSTYTAAIGIGEQAVEDASIQLDSSGPAVSKVDVFFLTDNTGSMGDLIEAVKQNAEQILDTIAGQNADQRFENIDVYFGVGSYRGDPNEGVSPGDAYILNLPISGDLDAVRAAIGDWDASGGGDIPEANFFALHQVATEGESTDGFGSSDPSGGISTGQVTGWRQGAGRVIVWSGDAVSHTSTVSRLEATQALVAEGVVVCAINTGGAGDGIDTNNQASNIASDTGGTLTNNVGGPSVIVDAILDAVADVTETVDLAFETVPSSIPGLQVEIECTDAAGCDGVPAGDSRSFRWTITGQSAGLYQFDILATGVVGAVSAVEIDVAGSCGDGVVDPGESCDDGNSASGDGCSDCLVEECWVCSGSPQTCAPDDGAPCDDGESCTGSDVCSGGTCAGFPVPNGTLCDSGDECSLQDWCVAGLCTGSAGSIIADTGAKLGVEGYSAVSISTLSDRARFSVGRQGFMEDDTLASAAVIRLGISSSVFDLESNVVKEGRNSSIRGAQGSLAAGGEVIGDFCTEPSFACAEGNPVEVLQFESRTLNPGAYGEVFVGTQAELILEAGEYDFCQIKGSPSSEIYVVGAGDTVIRVRDRLITGRKSTLAPQGASAPLIQSGGAVRFGVDSQTAALVEAPENLVKLSRGARLDGTVCSKKFATAKAGELVCTLTSSPSGAFVDGPALL